VGQSHPIARTDVSVTPRPRAYDLEGGALRHYHLALEARDIVRPSPPRAGLFDRTVLFRLRTRTPSKHALDEAERGQYRMRAGSVDKSGDEGSGEWQW
jgi:hypothetical protein